MKQSKQKLALNILLLVVIVGLILYLLKNSLGEIIDQLLATNPWVAVLVITLGLIYQGIEGRNIATIAQPFSQKFTTKDGFFASGTIAFFRVISFGSATALSEVWYYRNYMKTSQGIGVGAVHMIMYKLGLLLFSLFGLATQCFHLLETAPNMILFIILGMVVTAVIIGVLLLLSSSLNLQVWLVKWCHRHIHKPSWRDKVDQFNIQIYSLRDTVLTIIKDRVLMWRIIGLNILKLFFWFVIPYVVLSEHHQMDLLLTISFTAFTVILAGVIPTPAGIGSFEFVFLLLFKPPVGTVDAVAAMLLYRFATYVLPFLIGLVYSAIEKRKQLKAEIKDLKQSD